jgi:hypothetical protein
MRRDFWWCAAVVVYFGLVASPSLAAAQVQVREAAAAIDFTPEGAAAAGLTSSHAAIVIDQLEEATDERTDLADAQNQVEVKLAAVVVAIQAARSGSGVAEIVEIARQDLANAMAEFDAAVSALRSAAFAGLSTQQSGRLDAYSANKSSRLAPEFRVVDWSPEAIKRLEKALIAERRATVTGATVPTEAATLLASARSRADVAEAVTWRATRLASIQSVFDTFDAQ